MPRSRPPTRCSRPSRRPPPRTVWLLCAPSAEELVTTIRSRCRLVILRTPPAAAIAEVLGADGVDPGPGADRRPGRAGAHRPGAPAGHRPGGRRAARRRAGGAAAAHRPRPGAARPPRPGEGRGGGGRTRSPTELDEPERGALRRAFGEGSTGKGVAKAIRGVAGAMKDLEDRQKSRATRLKRDALDRALLDLAAFYRDVLAVQVGAAVELASAGHEADVRRLAAASAPETTVRRIQADHDLPGAAGAERGAAARGRGDDPRPGRRLTPAPDTRPASPPSRPWPALTGHGHRARPASAHAASVTAEASPGSDPAVPA